MDRIAGTVEFTLNGKVYKPKAALNYNMGSPLRESLMGPAGSPGYKETPQLAFVEGELFVTKGMSVKQITSMTDTTVLVKLANGTKLIVPDAHFESEGTAETEEGGLPFKFVSDFADEITA